MRPGETELEMVQRHVADGERHIDTQCALIAKMERTGGNIEVAVTLLESFVETQSLHREHLERLLDR